MAQAGGEHFTASGVALDHPELHGSPLIESLGQPQPDVTAADDRHHLARIAARHDPALDLAPSPRTCP